MLLSASDSAAAPTSLIRLRCRLLRGEEGQHRSGCHDERRRLAELAALGEIAERERRELSAADRARSSVPLDASAHDGEMPELLRAQDLDEGRSLEQRLKSKRRQQLLWAVSGCYARGLMLLQIVRWLRSYAAAVDGEVGLRRGRENDC